MLFRSQAATETFGFDVFDPLAATPASLADGVTGTAYSAALAATGGDGSYSWSLASGTLPAGLTLGTDGSVSGTPTATGSSTFTARVESGDGQAATETYTILVVSDLVIVTTFLPDGRTGVAYDQTLEAGGEIGRAHV